MAEYTSSIELKAVTRDLDKKLGKVTKDLKGIDAQVQKTQSGFKKMTTQASKGFDKLNKKLKENRAQIAGIAVAVSGIALKGVSDFKKFQSGIAQIATLGVKDLKKVEKQLDNVRKEFGITGAEATKGYYDIISAGAKEGAEALNQLAAATKLAKAGNTDLAGSIDIVTSGMNIFGKSGETASSITDKLFMSVKFGKTTVEELGATFGFVAPVVAAAGLGMSDYAAAMASVTAGGIKTNQATTGLKAVLSNIIKVTPKAAKEAKRLGIEFNVAALESKGFVGFMEEIKEAAGGDVEVLGRLFDSIESINTAAVLTSDKGFASLKRNMESMTDSAGATATALEVVQETADFQFAKFNASLSIMSKNIGAAVVPGLVDLAEAFAPVVDFMANMIAHNPGIVKVTISLTALATSLAFLGGPATIGLVALGGTFVMLLKKFKAFEQGGVAAFELIQLKWSNFIAGFQDMSISEIFQKMFDNSINWISKMMTKIKDKMADLWGFFADPVKEAVDAVDKFFYDLYIAVVGNSYVPDMVEGIKDSIAELWSGFVTPIRQMTERVKTYFEDLAGQDLTPSETIKTMWTDFTTALKEGWDKATAAVKKYWEATKGENQITPTDSETVTGNTVTDFLRSAAVLGVINTLLRGATAATLAWKTATADLGAAGVTPLAGFKEMGKFKFTGLRGEIQRVTQVLRELRAASTDDLAGGNTTDAKTTQRALQNASKLEQAIRKDRIANARTSGQEIIEIRASQQAKILEKLVAEADAKGVKLERGFMSRFFFGDGTMHTFSEKMLGLFRRLGVGFDGLISRLRVFTGGMDSFTTNVQSQRAASANAAVKTADDAVREARKGVTRAGVAKVATPLASPNMAQVDKELAAAEKRLADAEKKLAKATARAEKLNGSAGKIATAITKISELLRSTTASYNTWLVNSATTNRFAMALGQVSGGIAATLKSISVSFSNMKIGSTLASAMKVGKESRKFTTGLNIIAGIMSRAGAAFSTVFEQGAKATRGVAMVGQTVANSKAVSATGKAVVGMANFAKLPQAMRILGVIARKVLIPIFAVVDAFRGFTSTEELQKNLDSEAEEFTFAQKSISAISEAIGNFFGGFLQIGGMIADYFGAEHMAEYLKNIDLAPQVAKFFKGMKNIFDAVVDIMKAIFGTDDEGDGTESAFTTVIKRVGELLSGLLDTFLAITEAFAGIASGDLTLSQAATDIGTALGTFFLDVAQALIDGLAAGIKGLGSWGADLLKDLASGALEWLKEKFTFWGNDDDGAKSEINRNGIKEFNTGGPVFGAGTGTSDSIPAMLSNGEYVINAKQTSKYRSLLEAINGGHKLPGFKTGGEVGKSYQFLQFNRQQSPHADLTGGKGSFNLDRTMTMFVNNLDQTNPKVQQVVEMMTELDAATTNLTESQALEHDYTKRINRLLLELNSETAGLAETTSKAAGSVEKLSESAEVASNAWEGMGATLTAPIKQAFMEGGSIADGLKMGIHNMMRNIAGKFLDRAFAPIEASIDNMLQGFINNIGTSLTNVSGGAGTSAISGSGTLGGFIKSIFMSKGGIVPQYLATGGVASGYGPKGSDTVPAWLTPGEVVLNAGQQKDVANAMGKKGGGSTYVTNNINVSGNVDQRAIDQIKNVIASSPNEVNNAANTGKRNASGIRRSR